MTPLTDRQRETLTFIYHRVCTIGMQPTIREIASRFGVGLNAVAGCLKALTRKGYVAPSVVGSKGVQLLRWPDGTPFTGLVAAIRETPVVEEVTK